MMKAKPVRINRPTIRQRSETYRRMCVRAARTPLATLFSTLLSLALLAQGFVLTPTVNAQKKQKGGPVTVGGKRDTAQPSSQIVFPTRSAITVLPPINMQGLSQQVALAPANAAPGELRPIHAPNRIEQRNSTVPRRAAEVTADDDAPLAPPSSGVQSPPITRSFKSDGLTLGSIPPDTMGAVGDTQVMTTTNEKIIVQDRNGLVLSNVTLNSFWSTVLLGGAPPSTFDPKAYYDRFNDRFIIISTANAQVQTSATLVAVSQTNDALGTYNRYAIDADAAATAAGGKWADYPSVGYNGKWITVQVNLFGFGTTSGYQGPAVYVLEKAAAYNNTLATVSVFEGSFATCLASITQNVELGCGFTMVPHVDENNTNGNQYLIEDWDSTAAQLRITTISGTAAAPVLTVGTQFPQSPNSWRFDARIIGTSGGYVHQRQQNIYALSGNRVAGNDSRIQNAVLRNGSLWTTHHVMLPTIPTLAGSPASTGANPDNHTGIQWWEIDPTIVNNLAGTPPIQRAILADPTADNCHNGSGGTRAGCTPQGQFFTFPTIAVNQNEDVLIGYSRFSHLTLPKTAYSFRASSDAANTLRDSQTFREGVGNYNIGAGSPFNIRWGDYSSSMVDPLNDTDFWTIQEFADFQKEIFGPGQFAGVWATQWALVKPGTTTSTVGNLIISEFRLRGPAGPRDEFVELYNPSSAPLTVSTTDGSDGWALAFSANGTTATALATIPNGTTIPAGGHYLVVNNVAAAGIAPYGLNAYANTQVRASDGDAMYTPDLADNGGIAIFRTSDPANFAVGTRMDSAGFAGIAAGLFKEGTGIANIAGTPVSQITFVRRMLTGTPSDTNDNAADFAFLSTTQETLGVASQLGAPGPENLDSAIQKNSSVLLTLLDPAVAGGASPNRVRDLTPDPGNNSTNGTMSIRRTVQNTTGGTISRLRFRIVDITAGPPAVGIADLRARTSTPLVVAITGPNPACPGNSCAVQGLTLEEPALQPLGGAWNSTLSAGTVTLATPIAVGGTINVHFLLGVQQAGYFRFFVNVEALP